MLHLFFGCDKCTQPSKLYDSFDLIIYALTLKSSQVNRRTQAIQKHIDYLLPQEPHDRREAIQSLFKLKSKEIEERGVLMKLYQVGQATAFSSPISTQHAFNNNKTLLAASHLSNADLTWRLEKLDTLISDPKFTLNFHKTEVQRNAFVLNSSDFTSHLYTIQQNMNILLENLNADGYLNTIAKAFTLSSDQINARLAIIKQYQKLLNWQGHWLIEHSVDEIYSLAKKEHYRRYFMNDYLPKLGEEFQNVISLHSLVTNFFFFCFPTIPPLTFLLIRYDLNFRSLVRSMERCLTRPH